MCLVPPSYLRADPRCARQAHFQVFVVSPHPDDEIIGAGTRLPLIENVVVAQVTDGSPRDLADARANGFLTCEDYARARHAELIKAIRWIVYCEPHLDRLSRQARYAAAVTS